MVHRNRELIYFDPKFTGTENFSGEFSPVGNEKRKEFLTKYAAELKKHYGLGALPQKVVDPNELEGLLKQYALPKKDNKSVIQIDEMEAFVRERVSPYKGWQLYTFGAKVCDDVLCFSDGITPPVPAAKYEFEGKERLKICKFSLWVDKLRPHAKKKGVTIVSGKFFELRKGGKTVLKLHLLADGELYYLDGFELRTHPKHIRLGEVAEKTWSDITICLKEKTCDVFVGEELLGKELALYNGENPDTVFVSGGRDPLGEWKVKPILLQSATASIENFFEKEEEKSIRETSLGQVKLPFAIGTQLNKDKELVFRKRFNINGKKHAKLTIKSIDPCGYVYLNGQLVCEADNFLTKKVFIQKFLKEGDNLLEVVVLPRAPEVFYQWHSHSDPYNGWFFRGAFIETYEDNYIDELCVVTKRVGGGEVCCTVTASIECNGVARIYVRKIYPEVGEEKEIDNFAYYGKIAFAKDYTLKAEAWSPEAPNLYEFTVRIKDEAGDIFEKSIETGFRTIEQKNGEFYLNGKRILLNGALSMQFLPPYENIPVNHVCATDAQIVTQIEQIKRMNGNTLRMHFLGYGSNDERYARYADRAGCMLIWTTRLIDSVESVLIDPKWRMANAYVEQIKEVRQYPSIIMWEGSNEASGELSRVDGVYDEFVSAVKKADPSRLLCPCSHLYYGGGIYGERSDCGYYQDDGKSDQYFNKAESSFGWKDEKVVRSAHTYAILLGYGTSWEKFVAQDWPSQKGLLESKEHAYAITEYAVIGRACPHVPEAKAYFNANSYELGNEFASLGFWLSDEEYELSQAHQALCALYTNKKMRMLDVDGMLWCCLQSGANDGSYLKPIIDFYGYAKFAYYVLRDYYRNNYCVMDCDGPFWGADTTLKPVLIAEEGEYRVKVTLADDNDNIVFEKEYDAVANSWQTPLAAVAPNLKNVGYYTLTTETTKK